MKKEEWAYLQEAPPLKIPFGKYTVSNSEVLFYQRIGSVATQDPIWMLGTNNGEKVGVIAGEGLWRWRLYERGNLNKTSALDEILDRTVNYLATRESKTRFRLESTKKIQENENLIFQGEFYNESFELTNDEDVFLQIEKESGDKFDFVMKRKDNFYYLDAGVWEPGVYQYQAKLVQGGKSFEKSGQVSVTPISAEYISNRADFGLLSRISAKSGGEMVTARNLASLEQTLKSINAPVVVHTETKFEDLINLKWIFALLLLLLSLEWFVRKREGSI